MAAALDVESRIRTVESKVQVLTTKHTDLERRVETIDVKVTTLQSLVKEAQTDIAELKNKPDLVIRIVFSMCCFWILTRVF